MEVTLKFDDQPDVTFEEKTFKDCGIAVDGAVPVEELEKIIRDYEKKAEVLVECVNDKNRLKGREREKFAKVLRSVVDDYSVE